MSRRRRLLLWAGLLVALAGVGLVGAWWLIESDPASTARYTRLRLGMTEEEVLNVLGPPSWRPKMIPSGDLEMFTTVASQGDVEGICQEWTGKRYTISVFYSDDRRVRGVALEEPVHETLPDRLRRWLGL